MPSGTGMGESCTISTLGMSGSSGTIVSKEMASFSIVQLGKRLKASLIIQRKICKNFMLKSFNRF